MYKLLSCTNSSKQRVCASCIAKTLLNQGSDFTLLNWSLPSSFTPGKFECAVSPDVLKVPEITQDRGIKLDWVRWERIRGTAEWMGYSYSIVDVAVACIWRMVLQFLKTNEVIGTVVLRIEVSSHVCWSCSWRFWLDDCGGRSLLSPFRAYLGAQIGLTDGALINLFTRLDLWPMVEAWVRIWR